MVPDDPIRTAFTPLASLFGGMLIGAAAVMLMAAKGRIAGISGIVARLLPPYDDREAAGRLAFVLGLAAAPFAALLVTGEPPPLTIAAGPATLAAAGLLVGFGAVWGHGCTSGHGVCGLARLSPRSLAATATFMASAAATVLVTRHLL